MAMADGMAVSIASAGRPHSKAMPRETSRAAKVSSAPVGNWTLSGECVAGGGDEESVAKRPTKNFFMLNNLLRLLRPPIQQTW
jgi:hypothetical protein